MALQEVGANMKSRSLLAGVSADFGNNSPAAEM
jgi:hypothetical protein